MSYRLHFYALSNAELISILQEDKTFLDFEDLLCINCIESIYKVWDKAEPVFGIKSEAYKTFEDENPKVITKALLKEICLAFHHDYQNWLIRESTSIVHDYEVEEARKKPIELFSRVMHFKPNTDDEAAAKFNGQYLLHQEYLIHCSSGGEEINSKHFEELLDSQRLTDGNSMHDILLELCFLYKTFDESKTLILCGW